MSAEQCYGYIHTWELENALSIISSMFKNMNERIIVQKC
jgi:hypothetical protein